MELRKFYCLRKEEKMSYLSEPETHEQRMDNKINPFNARRGHQIFSCMNCEHTRVYGYGIIPAEKRALILCEGRCNKHTWHNFLRSI